MGISEVKQPMSSIPAFHKLPECDCCQFYTGNTLLLCPVHPNGIKQDQCLDFREDETAARRWKQFLGLDWVSEVGLEDEHLWLNSSEEELEESSYYNGESITSPKQRWSREQQTHLLDWHPMFTGRCPECEMPMEQPDLKQNWMCSNCGWVWSWKD